MNNPPLYDAVITGVAASSQGWITNSNPSSYQEEAQAAAALANEVDSLIPTIPTGATISQRELLTSIIKSVLAGRYPTNTTPIEYNGIAKAVTALFTEFNIELQDTSTGSSSQVLALTKFPTGFLNRTDSTITFDDGTRTFNITPIGPSYTIWYHGAELIKTSPDSIIWPNTEGLGAIYFNGEGVIQFTNDPNTIDNIFGGNGIPITAFYWDVTNSKTIRRIEERHDTSLPPSVHVYLHRYVSTVLQSGGQLENFTIGAGGNAVDAQFSISDFTVADEDIQWPWVNGAPQVLSPIAQLPILYLTGPGNGIWREKTADAFPLLYSGTGGYIGANGRLPWNEFTGGNWQLTQVTNADFVLMHYFGSTDLREAAFGVVGQAVYTSQALARQGANREINNLKNLLALLSTEKRPLGTVIYQTANIYANTPKARVVVTDTGENYVNWTATPVFTGVILV